MTSISTEPRITLVSTYEEVEAAVQALSRHPTLVLDCEGRDLCMPNGVLSIVSLADPMASDIHLFDVLALADKQNPSLSSLFSILCDKLVTKLVWDGRHRFMEIADTYGVLIDGVLDVQIVEVMLRPKHKLNGSMRAKHTVDYFKKSQAVMDHITNDPSILDGVDRTMGVEHCAGAVGVHKEIGGKGPATVKLHKAHGGDMWLLRPLPAALLDDAARNVRLIAAIHSRITPKGERAKACVPLEAMMSASVRYMRSWPSRELKAFHVPLELTKFIPLDTLHAPKPDERRFRCERCERMLSLGCFFTRGCRSVGCVC
ncbi:hypothetical protein C8Q74DRAFT_385926 [Fomes fomentarius]|nr:hypothetical protein C8Q74DRAFT_385926 [Fomes fomentarius]